MSTEGQAEKGVSLDAQRAKLLAYAELYDIDLVEIVEDAGESASTLQRPGLERALGMLGKTADAFLVVKLDRLTRSVRDLGDLIERYFTKGETALLSVSENIDTRTAAGRLVLNVLGSVSEWERSVISERTSAAMQHMAREGRYTGGGAPYGQKITSDGARVEPEPSEQAVIAEARELRGRGLSLRQVSRALELNGSLSRARKPFGAGQIARMAAPDDL